MMINEWLNYKVTNGNHEESQVTIAGLQFWTRDLSDTQSETQSTAN
jgi:hypothetical protein